MVNEVGRRDFLANAATAAAGTLAALPAIGGLAPQTAAAAKGEAAAPIGVGLVGAGDRGTYLLRILLGVEGVQIRAVCDPEENQLRRAQHLVEEQRQPKPEGFSNGPADYRRLCERKDVDLVVNATPWPLHGAVCLAALQAGKHVATEPPLAPTVEECWQLIEAAEKAKKQCALLENYCYQRDVLLVRNLIRQGLFGELMHAEGGYQKDARDTDFRPDAAGHLGWQGEFRKSRMGNVYPTHDLGPVAQWLDINRGDRLDYLVSMGGGARGFNEYAAQYLGRDNPLATRKFDMSDINLCLIRTVKGRTIYLISDTLLSRPQPRNLYRLLGSKGIFDWTLNKLYLEGKSPKRDRWQGDWESVAAYHDEFDHPIWRELRNRTLGSGYGAGDYLCVDRLIRALRAGVPADIDVYDAATWSSVVELSERSARNRSAAVDFPDFTHGRWKTGPS